MKTASLISKLKTFSRLSSYKSIWLALAAAFCFSLMALFAKASHLPVQEVIAARCLFILVVAYSLMKRRGQPVMGEAGNRALLILRGLFGYLGLSCYFFSLQGLPIGVAALIQYMSPIFSGLFALAVLQEAVAWGQWLSLLSGFVGVGFVSGVLPAGDLHVDTPLIFWLASITSAIMSAIAYVLVRRISLKGENTEVILFYFPLVAFPLTLIFGGPQFVWPQGPQWLLLLGVGIASYGGQVLLTTAIGGCKTAAATNMLYFGALFAAIWGLIFFGEPIGWDFVLGAVFIIGGRFLMGLGKPTATSDEHS